MPKEEAGPGVDELAVLAAVPRRVTVYTLDKSTDAQVPREIRVAPMTLDVCGECAAALKPIAEALGINIGIEQLPLIVADHHKSVRAIVASATEEPEAYIGTLPLDQFLKLATDVWEVNHAFFVHRVGPIGKALAAKLYGGVGPTSSTALPSMATPTP